MALLNLVGRNYGGKSPVSIKYQNLYSFKEGLILLCQSILETRGITYLHGSALFTIPLNFFIYPGIFHFMEYLFYAEALTIVSIFKITTFDLQLQLLPVFLFNFSRIFNQFVPGAHWLFICQQFIIRISVEWKTVTYIISELNMIE